MLDSCTDSLISLPTLLRQFSDATSMLYDAPNHLGIYARSQIANRKGVHFLRLSHIPAYTDSNGWTLLCWPEIFDAIAKRPRSSAEAAAVHDPLWRTPAAYAAQEELLCTSLLPPGCLFRDTHRAPLVRLLQALPAHYTHVEHGVTVVRAGGLMTKRGRKMWANIAHDLRVGLASVAPEDLGLMPKLYQLLHLALHRAVSEECLNPYVEYGLAWLDGYLYFHYGRALYTLEAELRQRNQVLFKKTVADTIIDFQTLIENKPRSTDGIDKAFYNSLLAPTMLTAKENATVPSLLKELDAYAAAGFMADGEDPLKVESEFGVFINLKHPTHSLINVFREYRECIERRRTLKSPLIAVARKRTYKSPTGMEGFDYLPRSTYRPAVHSCLVNALDLGYMPNHKNHMVPTLLEMKIHKSSVDEYFISIPEVLESFYAPLVEAERTGRHMKLSESESIRVPLTSKGTTQTQRRLFTFPKGAPDAQLFFHTELLKPGGWLEAEGNRIARAKTRWDDTEVIKLFDAFKLFMRWLYDAPSLYEANILSDELAFISQDERCDPEDTWESPIYLDNLYERCEYLYTRGRNMDLPWRQVQRWDQEISVPDERDRKRIVIRAPDFSQYDVHAIHRALRELQFLPGKWFLNREQRAEYIVRRWLPWQTGPAVEKRITVSLYDRTFHKNPPLPKTSEAMQNLLEEAKKRFGTPIMSST